MGVEHNLQMAAYKPCQNPFYQKKIVGNCMKCSDLKNKVMLKMTTPLGWLLWDSQVSSSSFSQEKICIKRKKGAFMHSHFNMKITFGRI